MELARGQVTDRPWAMTLGALGVRQCTGQLTLRAEGRQYCIVFDHGAVVGAASPLASDSAVRVALIHHMVAPSQTTELARRIAAAPDRDEIEILAETARLSFDQTLRLRRKVIEQRAARTFSIEQGEFVIDSDVEVPILTGLAIDIRSVIYLGARMNLSEQRLVNELRPFGLHFALDPDAAGELSHFGFTDAEKPILEALRIGTSLAELEAKHRDLDPRTAQAVVYSLVSCSVCAGVAPPSLRTDVADAAPDDFSVTMKRAPSGLTPSDIYSRTHTGRDVFVARAPTGGQSAVSPRTLTGQPQVSGTRTITAPQVSGGRTITGQPEPGRTPTGPASESRTTTSPRPSDFRTTSPLSGQPGSGQPDPAERPGQLARTTTPPFRGTVPRTVTGPRPTPTSTLRAPPAAPDEAGVPRSTSNPRTTTPPPSRAQTPTMNGGTSNGATSYGISSGVPQPAISAGAYGAAAGAPRTAAATEPPGAFGSGPVIASGGAYGAAVNAPGEASIARGTGTGPTPPGIVDASAIPESRAHTPSTGPTAVPATGRTTTPGTPLPATGRTATPGTTLPPATGRSQTPTASPRTRTPSPGGATMPPATAGSAPRRISATTPATPDPDAPVDPASAAKEAFKRGQSRLKVENLEEAIVEFTRAVELTPNEVDYAATLAWARFCYATDKQALAQVTRETLNKAIRKSQLPETARFYLGRVERMLGRDKEALRHFQEVIEAQPKHADAAAEIRVIEARLAQASTKDSGLFGRKR